MLAKINSSMPPKRCESLVVWWHVIWVYFKTHMCVCVCLCVYVCVRGSLFLGDLNHKFYNVWWWKSPVGIKRQNVWTQVWKCSICSIFVMFGLFIHFQAVVDAWSVNRTNFWFCVFLWPKNQYGWHCEIWVWLYKWLKSSEMVHICWRKYIEKM